MVFLTLNGTFQAGTILILTLTQDLGGVSFRQGTILILTLDLGGVSFRLHCLKGAIEGRKD